MILKKVKLTDFRQFYGTVEIEFATSPEKNVTIIHGENGVGKTALLNAIKWAFFAKVTSNFRNPGNLVSDTAKKNGKHTCKVEIEFIEDKRHFMLHRNYDQRSLKNVLKIYEKNDDVWSASLPEPELVINSMLPKE
ncbi:MAG: AAA family ATPase [gamma proteobacterium endosymbiont of Lamellibrachia anaximandri]|nr:AAA family ATPase [gamma proteobacterium endosymbiont of Lamellibrachia anaximandri]MBL3535742.1 AAA family ATPase [gamma proteobacterium endosymbiont of Lamellibrachia anaximandri]